MRKQLWGLLAAAVLAASPMPAFAALTGNEYPRTATYKLYAGGATAALVVSPQPLELNELINTNTSAQTATLTCYDNASAASGQVLWSGILGASQIVSIGVQSLNGITCQASAATLTGNGILILSR